jgi:hypothetical protein
MGDADLKYRSCGTTSTKGEIRRELCLSSASWVTVRSFLVSSLTTPEELWPHCEAGKRWTGCEMVGSSAKKSGFGCCQVECCRLPLFTAALYHAFSATAPNVKWLDILQVFSGRFTLTELSAYLTRPMW